MARLPRIGLTLGDPAGVGPEVAAMAMSDPRRPKADITPFGLLPGSKHVTPGRPTKRSARAALHALEQAVAAWKRGELDAIVTAPICKETLSQVGFEHPGHTEFFARACGRKPEEAVMMMHDRKLTVSLVTAHCSLRDALRRLTPARLERTVRATANFFHRLGLHQPRLAVAGLNPHAGEGGLFGHEEVRMLEPAVGKLRAAGLPVAGPFAADTLFLRAASGEFDAVVCLYHDQGLIPFKLLAFHTGVNVTLGLPLIRTSPDHGTAFDLAGKGRADHRSMLAALKLATRLVRKSR